MTLARRKKSEQSDGHQAADRPPQLLNGFHAAAGSSAALCGSECLANGTAENRDESL